MVFLGLLFLGLFFYPDDHRLVAVFDRHDLAVDLRNDRLALRWTCFKNFFDARQTLGDVGAGDTATCITYTNALMNVAVSDVLRPPSYAYGPYGSWAAKPI